MVPRNDQKEMWVEGLAKLTYLLNTGQRDLASLRDWRTKIKLTCQSCLGNKGEF